MATRMMMRQSVRPATALRRHLGRAQPRPAMLQRRNVQTAALAQPKSPVAEFSDSIGLPTDEGLFGFKPFAEVWCGRLAMMGFISSFAVELQTGQGTLQQIGITSSSSLLFGMLALFGTFTAGGAGYTAFLALSGRMPSADKARYRKFLLLDGEEELIQSARAVPTVADKFLSTRNSVDEVEQVSPAPMEEAAPAEQASTSGSATSTSGLAAVLSYEDKMFNNAELKYARTVEMDNGRAAMLGFLAAVLVEAATGKGIILQLIMWFKAMGLLGAASGF